MRARRVSRAACALGMAGLIVAACGSSDKKSAATTPATTAAAATTAAPAATTAAGTAAATTAAGTAGSTSAASTTAGSTPAASSGGLKIDTSKCVAPTGANIKLQLQWVAQAQFGGYYAAVDQGFYKDAGLNVDLIEAGTDTQPQHQLAIGAADFAISWVPKALAEREAGAKVTDIAQIFQRSGTLQVSFKDKNITTASEFKGKKIGNWGFGNEYEIFAALTKAGLDPAKDVTLVQQNFDMNGLLSGDIDAAEAMVYNEYAQVLEAKNPKTGALYTPDDLNVVSYEKEGVGMLQDAIWADQDKLSDPAYCGEAVAFVKASIKGWAFCRDNPDKCRDIVVAKGSKLGATHQLWQMNEVNKLVWPATNGVGVIDTAAWDRTVKTATGTKNLSGQTVLTKTPDPESWTNDIVDEALKELKAENIDVVGASFKPITVTLTAGGV
jgi:NitT/TauT family transport system substrate-binding protein